MGGPYLRYLRCCDFHHRQLPRPRPLQPLAQVFAIRLRHEIAALSGMIESAWEEVRVRGSVASAPVTCEWSPAVMSLLVLMVAAMLGAGCWWARTTWADQGDLALGIIAWVVIPLAGLVAATAFVVFALNVFDITD